MEIKWEKEKDIIIVKLIGRLDSEYIEIIDNRFKELLDKGEVKFICDLSELKYISSAGLRVFVNVTKTLFGNGGGIVLYGLSKELQDIFELTGLMNIISIASDKESAIAFFTHK